ncbi:Mu homology domain-containing protein [Lactarius pseudohatsudake]|nr:Mu homology domain-containing protein [Lactarius pseudohatsudake]
MTSRMFLDSLTANVGPKNATAEFLDVADSSFNPPSGHQDPTEGVSLPASCPLPFGPTFGGRDPSPTEGPAFPSASRYFEGTSFPSASTLQPPPSLHRSIELDHLCFSQILPQTFSAETDVTRDTSRVLVPPTRPLSWARSHSGESCGNETFSAPMAIRVSTRDSGTATTPLAVHLPDSTLNDYIPLDPYFTHDEAAPSFGHQHPPLTFRRPILGDLYPFYAFTPICTFLNILIEYLGEVTAPVLRDNFDIVHQLLEETLDAGGHPLTTAPNALRDIVLPPSLPPSAKYSVTGVTGPSGPSTNNLSAFSSPIPWRKAGLRYNHNDIYFDIVETLDAVVNKNGTIITSSVLGKVDVNCKLSGTPDPLLTLTNSHTISEPSSHPCVRLNRFAQSKALSFVPPDGRFTLMEYRFDPSASKPGAAPALTAAAAAQPKCKFRLHCAPHFPSPITAVRAFELSFTPRAGALEDVAVELYLGSGATGATCSAASGGSEWMYVPARRTLRWSLASSASAIPGAPRSASGPGRSATLRGTFASGEAHPRPARAAQISFALPAGALLSALKIDQLKLSGETYKPYKGVRGRALGRVEWRVEWK